MFDHFALSRPHFAPKRRLTLLVLEFLPSLVSLPRRSCNVLSCPVLQCPLHAWIVNVRLIIPEPSPNNTPSHKQQQHASSLVRAIGATVFLVALSIVSIVSSSCATLSPVVQQCIILPAAIAAVSPALQLILSRGFRWLATAAAQVEQPAGTA